MTHALVEKLFACPKRCSPVEPGKSVVRANVHGAKGDQHNLTNGTKFEKCLKRGITMKQFAMFLMLSWLSAVCVAQSSKKGEEEKVFSGKVKKVIDGDTILVLDGDIEQEVQLEGIDAPETKQPYGKESTKALEKMINGKEVTVKWKSMDNYDRILGHIYYDEKFINLEMLRMGAAWHYKQYNKSEEFAEAEEKAKEVKLGLWEESSPTPPWEFRRNNRTKDKE